MINTAPDNKEAMQELEFDETMEGAECEEAKCLELKREHQAATIEIAATRERKSRKVYNIGDICI